MTIKTQDTTTEALASSNQTETEASNHTAIAMKNEEAINIIERLIDGINPLSDEPLDPNHLCLESDIQRALQTTIPALQAKIKADERRAKLPANAGAAWTEAEDQQLAESFDNGDTVAMLIEKHQRTRGSIHSRLLKLGKITA